MKFFKIIPLIFIFFALTAQEGCQTTSGMKKMNVKEDSYNIVKMDRKPPQVPIRDIEAQPEPEQEPESNNNLKLEEENVFLDGISNNNP